MKVKIIVIVVTCLIIIAACKKNAPFAGAKIYTLNDYSPGAGYTAVFTYNSNGTIATEVKNNGIKTIYYYSANGDTVTAAQVNGLGQTTTAVEYILNGSGWADSSQGQLIAQHSSYAYTYASTGNWTQVKTYVDHVLQNTDNYTNNSANNPEEIQHVSASNVSTYDYYTFYSSNSNTIGVQNMGMYFLGVSAADLVSEDVQINANLDTADIILWHYMYNGSGYVDTAVAYHRNGALADSVTYTYY